MLFPTVQFAIFFTAVLGLATLVRSHFRTWRVFMVVASFFFYCYWDPRFGFLLAGSIAWNYALGRLIAARRFETEAKSAAVAVGADGLGSRVLLDQPAVLETDGPFLAEVESGPRGSTPASSIRWLLALGIAGNLGALFWFKYYGFFVTSAVNGLDRLGVSSSLHVVQVVLPIGISFFTFQAISYLVDIGRGRVRPLAFLDFAVYLSFFPHLLSGPIVRASEFGPQLRPVEKLDVPIGDAAWLVVAGLVKKVLVATFLTEHIVDPVFGSPGTHGSLEVLFATYAFAVVIYADFSGYTDIASGCALLLGIRFPRNFRSPYAALSLQEFWRRWHMSLSRWLRDYVYIPLGGSRGGRATVIRNLAITFVLSGLWHGAAWHFVAWGALLAGWIIIERFVLRLSPEASGVTGAARWLVTFHVLCLGWIFFRADSVNRAIEMLRRIADFSGPTALVTLPVVGVTFGMIAAQWLPERLAERVRDAFAGLALVPQAALVATSLVLIQSVGPQGVPPFIYFRF